MNKQEMINAIKKAVLDNQKDIIDVANQIANNPEYGYKETFATNLLATKLEELGLKVDRNIAITGARAYGNANKQGLKVAIMGEMDAVPCPAHKGANLETGASHSCGHNIQSAIMYGVAVALVKSGVLNELDGKVDFFALPAEEFIELDYRSKLVAEGKLKYFGGKPELVSRGAFDDVDISIISHMSPITKKLHIGASCVGFMVKKINFIGKASHAGGAPHLGINALNSANIALNAIHNLRETFKDDDHIRVHPIITKGGTGVNSVPDDVKIETYIRGANLDAILETNVKVNRALIAGALAIGAEVIIEDIPGYLPYKGDKLLEETYIESAKNFMKESDILREGLYTFSQDIGDISHLLPTLNFFMGGMKGNLHMSDYEITNEETAFLLPIMATATCVVDLLTNGGAKAKEIKDNFKPLFNKTDYLKLLDSIKSIKTFNPAKDLGL